MDSHRPGTSAAGIALWNHDRARLPNAIAPQPDVEERDRGSRHRNYRQLWLEPGSFSCPGSRRSAHSWELFRPIVQNRDQRRRGHVLRDRGMRKCRQAVLCRRMDSPLFFLTRRLIDPAIMEPPQPLVVAFAVDEEL